MLKEQRCADAEALALAELARLPYDEDRLVSHWKQQQQQRLVGFPTTSPPAHVCMLTRARLLCGATRPPCAG